METQNTGVDNDLKDKIEKVEQALNSHEKECEQRHERITEQFESIKSDIKEAKSDRKESRAELKSDIKESRAELRSDIKESRAELRSDIKNSNSELRSDIKEVKSEFKSDIREQTAGFRWFASFCVGIVLAAIAALGFWNSLRNSEGNSGGNSGPNVYQKVAYSTFQSTGNWELDKAWLMGNYVELTHDQIMKFVSTMPDSVQQQAMKWLEQLNSENVDIQSARASVENQEP